MSDFGSEIIIVLILLAVGTLLLMLSGLDGLTETWRGRLILLVGLLIFPGLIWMGTTVEAIHQSSSTEFCMSCHEMHAFGQTLMIDDMEVVAAGHFQNRLVPRDSACFTCHTNYAMFGDMRAKLTGLGHMWVHYLGTVPAAEKMETYVEYPNANCLSCHRGARGFEGEGKHDSADAPMAEILAGDVSCMASGCHDLVHPVDELKRYTYWRPEPLPAELGSLELPPEEETGQAVDVEELFGDGGDGTEAGMDAAGEDELDDETDDEGLAEVTE